MSTAPFIQKAKEFEKLDRECIELSYEHVPSSSQETIQHMAELFGICHSAWSLWNEIKLELGELKSLRISDEDVRQIIRKTRDNYDFFSIRQYRSLASFLNTKIENPQERFLTSADDWIGDRFGELVDEFHSWFDVGDYYYRKARVGCIVVPYRSDQAVDAYYSEIRDAYAYQLYRACVALCRALIEFVLHDTLKRRRLLKESDAVDIKTARQRQFYLQSLIKEADRNKILNKTEREKAWHVKKQAEKVLHLRDRSGYEETGPTDDDVLEVIRCTIAVVEAVLSPTISSPR